MKKGKDSEDFINDILDYVDSLEADEQLLFISNVVSRLSLTGKLNHIERLGILDCARVDVINNIINPDINEEIGNLTSN